jgi:twitching motility protein PilT
MTAPIDSIIRIMQQRGATELRVGTGRAPRMFRHGAQQRLTMPETSGDELALLLGDIVSGERAEELHDGKRVELSYDAGPLGNFHVVLTPRSEEPGFDVVFVASAVATEARQAVRQPPAPAPSAASIPAAAAPSQAARESAPVLANASPLGEEPATGPSAELSRLVQEARELRASDVHVRTGDVVRVRVDGRLRVISAEATIDTERLIGDCLDASARARLAQGCSADVAFDVPGAGRVRANVYTTSEGLAAAMRILPEHAPALASLQLPASIDDLIDLPHGLVIVCGPTGAGKSTSLASLAQEAMRRRPIAVVSLEDPIEYLLRPPNAGSLVRQREVGRDVRDFSSGLRDALREDPDVILVGEMRDPESIALALTAAETGHLVLTSLHSRSAASAVERIIDAYPPERQSQIRVQLADALRAVVAQRLLPRAKGSGRLVAMEVLRVNHAVASAIREGKTAQIPSIVQSSRKDGMIPLERCLADLVRAGHITADAARAVANEPTSLDTYLRG